MPARNLWQLGHRQRASQHPTIPTISTMVAPINTRWVSPAVKLAARAAARVSAIAGDDKPPRFWDEALETDKASLF